MRLEYYELHQTPNEKQKEKLIFCPGPHDLRPHHHGKKRKDASTDSGLGASAQTLVLRRIMGTRSGLGVEGTLSTPTVWEKKTLTVTSCIMIATVAVSGCLLAAGVASIWNQFVLVARRVKHALASSSRSKLLHATVAID